jgi:hypothetical protein
VLEKMKRKDSPTTPLESINNFNSIMDVEPAQHNNQVEGGLYDDIIHQLMRLPKGMALGDATYKDDFIRDIHTGNYSYRCRESRAEYETVLVGEILPRACGTKFSAIGNHYLGMANTVKELSLTVACAINL